MNILILNWKDIKNPTAGGAELVTYEHAKRWVKAGYSVTWLSSSFKNLKKEEFIEGIKIRRFGNIYSVYLYAPFYYLFSGNKFDIVVDEVHGIPFFTPLYVRKPKLVLIHEIAGEIWDYMYSFPLNYIGRFLEKIYLRIYSNNYFWTDANATIDELVESGIDRKKCHAIPCPSKLTITSALPKKYSSPTFVWVSRIVRMKGIEDVLAAFEIIHKNICDSKLLVIGDGDKEYVKYVQKVLIPKYNLKKHVDFLGYVKEGKKKEILGRSHLLLHASVKEGWGIVVIEAASQGTPSIVYNVPGLSESVINNKTGIVLKKNNPEEMAKQSIQLIKNQKKYKSIQLNSIEWAKSLSWNKSANQSIKLINSITK